MEVEHNTPSEPKVLVARDEGEGNRLKVVKGQKRGKLDLLDPLKAKQNDFIVLDRHANPLENFFKTISIKLKTRRIQASIW